MKLTKFAYGIVATLALVLLAASVADAFTCQSACNQVRRGCRAEAKFDRNIAFAVCDTDRRECAGHCADTATSCAEACAEDDADCAADCEADGEACREGCATDRDACRDAGKVVRDDANLLCDEERGACRGLCNEADDDACIRACANAAGACFKDLRSSHKECKAACAEGDDSRACRRGCKTEQIAAIGACTSGLDACLTGCLPTTTTSTTTTTTLAP